MRNDAISEDTQAAVDLIRSLCASYIDFPTDLWIDVSDFRDEVQFEIRVKSDDMKRMVGSNRGMHIAALTHLVAAMGTARGIVHKIRLLEPEPGVRRPSYPKNVAEEFAPAPFAKLIHHVVLACGVESQIVTAKLNAPDERPLSFIFSVYTRTNEDFESLTVSPTEARNNLSVASALTILMDATAKRNGVVFSLSFPPPAHSNPPDNL